MQQWDGDGFGMDDHPPATPAEADREEAWNKARERSDEAWILTDRDVWHKNPFYDGPPVPHPEDDPEYDLDEDDLDEECLSDEGLDQDSLDFTGPEDGNPMDNDYGPDIPF